MYSLHGNVSVCLLVFVTVYAIRIWHIVVVVPDRT